MSMLMLYDKKCCLLINGNFKFKFKFKYCFETDETLIYSLLINLKNELS